MFGEFTSFRLEAIEIIIYNTEGSLLYLMRIISNRYSQLKVNRLVKLFKILC